MNAGAVAAGQQRRRRRAGEMNTAESNFFYTFKYPFWF